MVQVLTPDGWVSMPAKEAAAYPASMPKQPTSTAAIDRDHDFPDSYFDGRELPYYRPPALHIARPQVESFGPVSPQYYYVRPEQTPNGLSPGQYGRIDNYTPGQYTSKGYEPGNYRGDGVYTRPEYTPQGYIPGNWRAEPLPFGQTTFGSSSTSNGRH